MYLATFTSTRAAGRTLVVKLSQQPLNRISEVELVRQTRERGVDHFPETLRTRDLWKLSEGIRRHFVFQKTDRWEDRILRCIVLPRYIPLRQRLLNPDSLVTMAKQLLKCQSLDPSSIQSYL